jgi:hypothetical protein
MKSPACNKLVLIDRQRWFSHEHSKSLCFFLSKQFMAFYSIRDAHSLASTCAKCLAWLEETEKCPHVAFSFQESMCWSFIHLASKTDRWSQASTKLELHFSLHAHKCGIETGRQSVRKHACIFNNTCCVLTKPASLLRSAKIMHNMKWYSTCL